MLHGTPSRVSGEGDFRQVRQDAAHCTATPPALYLSCWPSNNPSVLRDLYAAVAGGGPAGGGRQAPNSATGATAGHSGRDFPGGPAAELARLYELHVRSLIAIQARLGALRRPEGRPASAGGVIGPGGPGSESGGVTAGVSAVRDP